jgi:hypothetical protein
LQHAAIILKSGERVPFIVQEGSLLEKLIGDQKEKLGSKLRFYTGRTDLPQEKCTVRKLSAHSYEKIL